VGQAPISHRFPNNPSMELQVGQYLPWSCEWVTCHILDSYHICIVVKQVSSTVFHVIMSPASRVEDYE